MTWHLPRTRRYPTITPLLPILHFHPQNPHLLIYASNSPNALVRAVSRGMQAQMADFHASSGTIVNIPTPTELWEVPIVSSLDSLNFIR